MTEQEERLAKIRQEMQDLQTEIFKSYQDKEEALKKMHVDLQYAFATVLREAHKELQADLLRIMREKLHAYLESFTLPQKFEEAVATSMSYHMRDWVEKFFREHSQKLAAKLIGFLEIPAEKETTDG